MPTPQERRTNDDQQREHIYHLLLWLLPCLMGAGLAVAGVLLAAKAGGEPDPAGTLVTGLVLALVGLVLLVFSAMVVRTYYRAWKRAVEPAQPPPVADEPEAE